MTARGRDLSRTPRATGRARAGRPVVLKIGGELLETAQRTKEVGRAIAGLRGGDPLVVVHGGGRDIDAALARAGIAKRQVDGLRITDEATLEVVVSVLAGILNTRLVAAVSAAGGDGVGLTGADGAIGLVEKAAPHGAADGTQVDLGQVGTPVRGQPLDLLHGLCRRGYVPIVATIGISRSGELYNVNADTFAAYLAGAMGAQRLIVAGGTSGVLDEHGETISTLDPADVDRLIGAGTASAGMIAKLSACRDALTLGVGEVVIADGRDLSGITRLVRHGFRVGVAGCTQLTERPSPQQSQSSRQSAKPRPQNFVSKNRSVTSVVGR